MDVFAAFGALGACLFCLVAGGVMVETAWAHHKEKSRVGRALMWLSLLFLLAFVSSLFGGNGSK